VSAPFVTTASSPAAPILAAPVVQAIAPLALAEPRLVTPAPAAPIVIKTIPAVVDDFEIPVNPLRR
jgi:hypothetical protein